MGDILHRFKVSSGTIIQTWITISFLNIKRSIHIKGVHNVRIYIAYRYDRYVGSTPACIVILCHWLSMLYCALLLLIASTKQSVSMV